MSTRKKLTHRFFHAALALLLTMAAQAQAAAGKVEVIWLGQAAFKIPPPGGEVIVTEAWLRTNPITPPAYKRLKVFGQGDPDALRHQAAGRGHGPGVQRRDGQQERAEGLHRRGRVAPDFLKMSF